MKLTQPQQSVVNTMNKHHFYYPQRGVVLFFALLALAIMSIASVALIRGVDTNNLVTGNLVFRQSASISASQAFESIAKEMSEVNPTQNNINKAYYESCNTFDNTPANNTCKADKLTNATFWEGISKPVPTTVDGNDAITNGEDKFGNKLTYVVERMCSSNYSDETAKNDFSHALQHCLMSDGGESPNSAGLVVGQNQNALEGSDIPGSPLYRITLRIVGPKNTLSYLQSYYSN